MTDEEIIKTAAEPHLIVTAAKANEYLGRLNAIITDLRLETSELQLKADLHLNMLLKQENKTDSLKKSEWKISPEYREWQKKKGMLADIRAIRRNLERHQEILQQQERFAPHSGGYKRVIE